MKKIGVLGLLICMIIVALNYVTNRQTLAENEDTGVFLTRAFASTHAKVNGYSVHNWSVLDNNFRDGESLKAMGEKLNKTFGIQGGKETLDQTGGDQNAYTVRGTWADGSDVQLDLTSMKFTEQEPQTVLVLRVEHAGSDLTDYTHAIQQVRDTARQAGTVPQISTCIKGLLADKMNIGASNSLVQDVFAAVHAKEIEGVRSDLVSSVSGYSPLTKDYILTNGHKMNLQVAVHYDAYQGKTLVLVGSPIVTIEY